MAAMAARARAPYTGTMKRRARVLAATILALGAGAAGSLSVRTVDSPAAVTQEALRQSLRRLWSDHAYWMRDYVKDAVYLHPQRRFVSGRLLRAQDEIGEAYGAYFGREQGARLALLLREHVEIAADVIAAAKSRDAPRLKAADARWRANARSTADFLSAAGPYWERERLRELFDARVTWAAREIAAQIEADWAADVPAAEGAQEQSLRLADALADEIIARFPERFR